MVPPQSEMLAVLFSGAVKQDPRIVRKHVESQCFLGLCSDLMLGSCFGPSLRRSDLTSKLPGNHWLLVIEEQLDSVKEGRHFPGINPPARTPMTNIIRKEWIIGRNSQVLNEVNEDGDSIMKVRITLITMLEEATVGGHDGH